MGVFARFTKNRKGIFLCILSLNILFVCVWIFVQGQTPRRRLFTYGQQINESFPNTSLFKPELDVTESNVRLWQGKFYSSLASAVKRHSKSLTTWKALALYAQSQSLLSDINQITLPGNEPRQTVKTTSQNRLLQFLETASCQTITPDVVLYNRVFKTGSETTGALFSFVASMMNYSYIRENTEDFYDRGQSRPFPMIIEHRVKQVKRPIFFNAHFYFRNNLKIQRTHTYINQIRHPVDRYISHYAYMRTTNRPRQRVKYMIDSGEFYETIEQCFEKQGQGCKYNVITRFFCGTESFCKSDAKKALERAKENILNHYATVGLLEHFHLSLKIIQRRLPYFLPVVPEEPLHMKLNEGKKKFNSSSVSKEMIEKIKRANWADMELYEFVTEMFWKQVKACGIS